MRENNLSMVDLEQKHGFLYWVPLFLIPIICWGFYWYVEFDFQLIKLTSFVVSLFLLIIYSKDITQTRKGYFERDISLFILSFLLSICTSFLYWGQNPVLTFRAGVATLSILFFFTLRRRNIDFKHIEKICIIFSIIYTTLWLYGISRAPDVTFGNAAELDDSRGFIRINQLNGQDMVALLYCISLVKISNSKKISKILWICATIGTFVLLFLTLTRILFAASVVVAIVYLLRKKSLTIILIATFFSFGGSQILMKNEIFSSLTDLTLMNIQEDSDSDMRHPEYEGAFSLFPFHVGTVLLGNGAPHVESSYGQYEENLKKQYRFNRSDAGFVGLYTTFGLFMIFLMIRLFVRVIKYKTPPECLPYKLFIILLFFSNLTMYTFWTYGIAFAMSLFVLDKAKDDSICFIS